METDGDVVMRDTMTGILDDVDVMRRQSVMIADWNKGILQVSDQLQLERVAIGSRASRIRDEQETMRKQFNACQQAHQDEMNQMRRLAEWHKDKADNSALHEQVYANAVVQLGNKAWQELYERDIKVELLEKRSDVLSDWVSGLESHAQNVYDQAVERVRWDDQEMAAQQKKCEEHVKDIRKLSWEIETRQAVLQDYERLQRIIPQAQKQYDQMREEAERGSWTILTLQGKIQSLQTSVSDQSQVDDSGLRDQLETKERELMAIRKGAEVLQQQLAETGADRDRTVASLRRTESQLKYGQGIVSDMATRHHSELLQETTEVSRLREEVKTVTDELAASKGALSTKAIVRVQGEVQSDQEKQIKELTARVNELAGAPKSIFGSSATARSASRASSAAASECESSEWSEWQEDYDYCYDEEDKEEEEAQPDEVLPDDGPDTNPDKATGVKMTKDEGDGEVKRTTITIKHPQSTTTPSRKIVYSTTVLSPTKKGDSVIDCKDTVQMKLDISS